MKTATQTTHAALVTTTYDALQAQVLDEDRYGMRCEASGVRAAAKGQTDAAEWYHAEMRASWARAEKAIDLRLALIGTEPDLTAVVRARCHLEAMIKAIA